MKYLLLLASCALVSTCATITPTETQQCADSVNLILKSGLQDYKTIQAVKHVK